MRGSLFSSYTPEDPNQKAGFDELLKLFLQLLQYTSGDASEALDWMNELDRKYEMTGPDYGMGDFIKDLEQRGYLKKNENGEFNLTGKTEQAIRSSALEEVFGKMKKAGPGQHKTNLTGNGGELTADRRDYKFGDSSDQIDFTASLRNAQIQHGIDQLHLTENNLEVMEAEHQSQSSSVLMIDISHSMILYGEDRITPAKKVAMALAEFIKKRYPKDTLDIIVFGNDAWPIELKDLPYLQVGPYHTNTVAGLELAMDILRRRKNPNKNIFMFTDGKPTCLKENGEYYQNSFGLDRKIINRTLNIAAQCRKLKIHITTFMIAQDPYLQQFVEEFTETCNGKAFYSSLSGLGEFMIRDFEANRKKRK